MLLQRASAAVLLAVLYFLQLFAARAESARSALVIGNSSYAFAPLANPPHDAADVAQALRGAGFDVEIVLDANRRKMLEAIEQFGSALARRKGVGFFYYAGHGIQISGENYLMPVDTKIESETALKRSTIKASTAADAMAATGAGLNIVVLDACRNNPLTSAGFRGLSRMDTSDRLFVSFSTKPGAEALDGEGRNSPYAKNLAVALATRGLNLESVFKQTLKGVYEDTKGQQVPWISSSYFDEFVFLPGTSAVVPVAEERVQAKLPPALTGVYRADGANPDGSRYRGITAVGRSGTQVQFRWWIGKQIFNGMGDFAGRMLVVNWGDKTPVIYAVDRHGILAGEWADRKAIERLELFAAAGPGVHGLAEGHYAVTGRNPRRDSYSGTVDIKRRPEGGYVFDWKVGATAYHGEGELNDGIVTVYWGDGQPVVYALTGNRELRGLWSNGDGEETLSLME
jgi:hypothetical protein